MLVELTPQFWNDFVRDFWEQKPTAFSDVKTPFQFFDEQYAFQIFKKASELYRSGNLECKLRFFAGIHPVSYPEDMLLSPSETSFYEYNARIRRTLKSSPYMIIVNNIQVLDYGLWEAECKFLRGLYDIIGLPVGFAESAIILGEYDSTPFGVHEDVISNFYFPVIGRKKVRTWPNSFLKEYPHLGRAHNYMRFLKNSETIETAVGGMIYWPSSAWHIAESSGGFTFAFGIGISTDKTLFDRTSQTCDDIIACESPLKRKFVFPFMDKGMMKCTEFFNNCLFSIPNVINELKLTTQLKKAWLLRTSGYAFDYVPKLENEVPLHISQPFQLSSTHPLYWFQSKKVELFISAAGHGFSIQTEPWIPYVLEVICSGSVFTVDQLISELANHSSEREVILKFVSLLLRSRAIKKVDTQPELTSVYPTSEVSTSGNRQNES